jgi:hypothetical protein
MFAAPVDFEPGMRFRTFDNGPVLEWLGVEPIVSRFPGKSRVRVLVRGGVAFVADVSSRFQVVEFGERR